MDMPDDIPGCNRKCGMVFHMTGGMHKTNCDLYPWQKQIEDLKMALRLLIKEPEDDLTKLIVDEIVKQHNLVVD